MTKTKTIKTATGGIDPAILGGIAVKVEAILGFTEMTVAELSALPPGKSFRLDSKLGAPIELKVNGVTLAYGELVAVGDHFGVKILEVATG